MAARTDTAYVWRDKVDREARCKRTWYASYGKELGLGSRPVTEPDRPLTPRMTSGMKWVERRVRHYPFQIEDQLRQTVDRLERDIEHPEAVAESPHTVLGTYYGPALHGSMPLRWSRFTERQPTPVPSLKSVSVRSATASVRSAASMRSAASAMSGVSQQLSRKSGASLQSLGSVSISSSSGERRKELLLQRQVCERLRSGSRWRNPNPTLPHSPWPPLHPHPSDGPLAPPRVVSHLTPRPPPTHTPATQAQLEQQLKQVESMLSNTAPSTTATTLQLSDWQPPPTALSGASADRLAPPSAPRSRPLPVGYLMEA